MASGKKIAIGLAGLALLSYCGYEWYKIYSEAKSLPSPATPGNVPQGTPPATNTNTAVKPADKEVKKEISADEVLKSGEAGILNKILFGKADGSGIYDTTFHKVGVTKKGQELGKAFKADKASNGTYNLKYQDKDGNYRIVNSASVNVKV